MTEPIRIGDATLYLGDCLDILPMLGPVDAVVTDPPFGANYKSGHFGYLSRSIPGDNDTTLRDALLDAWHGPALVFGTWKSPRPKATKMVLVWDTGGALGMGDLSIPWKPSHQEIYVIGTGFSGPRTSDVLYSPPVQSMASNGRVHPNEKPIPLLVMLLEKCPEKWTIFDPFMGSGTTGVACARLGRKFIGIEIEPRYFDIACKRIAREYEQLKLFPPEEKREAVQLGLGFAALASVKEVRDA